MPDNDDLPLLLDEAKTMWNVGAYHENIVNLQGITAHEEGGILCQVSIMYTQYYNIFRTRLYVCIAQEMK